MRAVFSGAEDAKPLPQRIEAHEQFTITRLDEIKQIKGSPTSSMPCSPKTRRWEADNIVLPMVGMGGPWARAD